MKKVILPIGIIVIIIAGFLLSGCGVALVKKEAGPTTNREYAYTNFTVVEVGYAFELEVIPADSYSITISAGENVFDHIEVAKKGNKLEIGMDTTFFHFLRSPKVKITMPRLTGLHLSGASEGNVTGFSSSDDFDLTLSGASELFVDIETGDFKCEMSGASELAMDTETGDFKCKMSGASDVTGSLKATSCDIELSGASEIKLIGSGGNIIIDASGASQLHLLGFSAIDADVSLSGASDASLDINGILDINLSGSSKLEYTGNPTLGDFSLTGGSELERR